MFGATKINWIIKGLRVGIVVGNTSAVDRQLIAAEC